MAVPFSSRRALRWLAATNSGRKLGPGAVDRLDKALTGVRFQLCFDTDGSSRFEPVTPGVDGALGKLLEIVTAARHRGTWKRIKICLPVSSPRATPVVDWQAIDFAPTLHGILTVRPGVTP